MIEIILGKADPMHLIEIGCPSNEYRPEAELIYKGIKDSEKGFILWECIQKVFLKMFDEKLEKNVCKSIAADIASKFSCCMLVDQLRQTECLRNMDENYTLKVHENFILEWKEYNACNHKWSMWEELESPTCTEMGVKERYCSKCGKVESATIDIDTEGGHFWINSEVNKPATCTEDGYIGGAYCSYCHRTKEDEIIPKTGHHLSGIYEVKPGIRKYTCSYCNYYEYVLDIRAAEGYDDPNYYMNGIVGRDENAMSKWNVSNVIENGTYNIQVSAAGNVYEKRKWYNMSKPELCVNNEVENPTDYWDGDYLYYLFTNNSNIYPNVKKDWEELGYNNKDIFVYGDFILNVSFRSVTEITLIHGVTNISLKIDGIKLCKVIN